MSEKPKPREWWIEAFGKTNVLPQNRSFYACDKEQMDYRAGFAEECRQEFYAKHTHVIEKSAYDSLKNELKELKLLTESYRSILAKIVAGWDIEGAGHFGIIGPIEEYRKALEQKK